MVRVRRSLVILRVATHACRRGDVVVIVDVAVRTLPRRHGMQPRQRKSRNRVIKACALPRRGAVALLARLREVGGHVIRIAGPVVIVQVAADAGRVGDVVVVVYVAVRTLPWRHGMQSRQREGRLRVVELRWLPARRVMASFASLRKSSLLVIGIRRSLEILQVAGNASCRSDVVIVVDVAIGALPRRDGVRSIQRKIDRVVIETRGLPCHCAVTLLAGLRKMRQHVVGIRRRLEVFQMA